MKKAILAVCAVFLCYWAVSVSADLEIFKDYDMGKSVYSMTTINVDPNMGDAYLEGLKQTWVASNKIAKDLGQIKDYRIYSSELPASGEFNLVLVVEFESGANLEPNQVNYQAFMKAWGENRQKQSEAIVKDYPSMRTITGEYRLREILLK